MCVWKREKQEEAQNHMITEKERLANSWKLNWPQESQQPPAIVFFVPIYSKIQLLSTVPTPTPLSIRKHKCFIISMTPLSSTTCQWPALPFFIYIFFFFIFFYNNTPNTAIDANTSLSLSLWAHNLYRSSDGPCCGLMAFQMDRKWASGHQNFFFFCSYVGPING